MEPVYTLFRCFYPTPLIYRSGNARKKKEKKAHTISEKSKWSASSPSRVEAHVPLLMDTKVLPATQPGAALLLSISQALKHPASALKRHKMLCETKGRTAPQSQVISRRTGPAEKPDKPGNSAYLNEKKKPNKQENKKDKPI